MTPEKQREFGIELCSLLNRYSVENDSDTPDFILAAHLISCLNAFSNSVKARRSWWGEKERSGFSYTTLPIEALNK